MNWRRCFALVLWVGDVSGARTAFWAQSLEMLRCALMTLRGNDVEFFRGILDSLVQSCTWAFRFSPEGNPDDTCVTAARAFSAANLHSMMHGLTGALMQTHFQLVSRHNNGQMIAWAAQPNGNTHPDPALDLLQTHVRGIVEFPLTRACSIHIVRTCSSQWMSGFYTHQK